MGNIDENGDNKIMEIGSIDKKNGTSIGLNLGGRRDHRAVKDEVVNAVINKWTVEDSTRLLVLHDVPTRPRTARLTHSSRPVGMSPAMR